MITDNITMKWVLHYLAIWFFMSSAAQAARILMLPVAMHSHFNCFTTIAVELAKRGHQIDLYFLDNFKAPQSIVDQYEQINYITWKGDENVNQMDDNIKKLIEDALQSGGDVMQTIKKMRQGFEEFCEYGLMHCEDQLETLQANKYDMAIVDNMFMMQCFYMIPHRLQVPIISLVDMQQHWLAKLPWLPSVVPNDMLPYTNKMSFTQRLMNSLLFVFMPIAPLGPTIKTELFQKYSKYGEIRSLDEVVTKTQLWLYTHDVVLDYPDPSMPNIINVGGLSTKPAKALPTELQDLINNWPSGFIVVSFGSGLSYLPPNKAKIMLDVFAKLDLLIIWRFQNRDNLDIPKNVHILDWLPQNDLLGHDKARLFITHGGRSGLFEGIYHGIPLFVIPIFGDQPHNGQKVLARGYGDVGDIVKIDVEELQKKITTVLSDEKHKDNIMKASRIYRSRPNTPAERSADGIEHILQFGGEHLRSSAFDMPWYQYWMLDVLGLALILVHVVIYLVRKLVNAIYQRCCRSGKKEKQS